MNAAFLGLALVAAANPKLLALDLLLIENRRARLMFACILLGGLAVSLTIGLLDVFVLHADAVQTQGSLSAGLDLGLGIALLIIGSLLATGRLHRRQRAAAAPGPGLPAKSEQPAKADSWAQRVLREPRLGLAVLIGAIVGLPGASYLTALHEQITGTSSTAVQAIAVVVFSLIAFMLVIIPFALLELRPDATKARLLSVQVWLTGHARQLIAAIALLLGAYLTVSGLVRLH